MRPLVEIYLRVARYSFLFSYKNVGPNIQEILDDGGKVVRKNLEINKAIGILTFRHKIVLSSK